MKNQRDRDFIKICRQIISESREALTAAEVAMAAAMRPAPEFYISYNHALRKISRMRRHGFNESAEGNAAIYKDLNSRAEEVMKKRSCSLAEALALVLAQGNAPRFYLTPKTAVFLYSTIRSRRRRVRRHSKSGPLAVNAEP